MNPSWSEVNAAVMAVLGSFVRPSRSVGTSAKARGEVFVERLFALRHAEAIHDGIDEVRVLAGTVVTPLARDLLRKRRVSLRVVSGREADLAAGRGRGEWGFAIDSRSGQGDALRRLLLEGRDWAEVEGEAAAWVVAAEGRGALVIADEASIATWRSNRVGGIRAASVSDPDAVSRAIHHLGPNLIVVEPSGKSIYLLKQIGERFRMGGAPTPPDTLAVPSERPPFPPAKDLARRAGMVATPINFSNVNGVTTGVNR